MTIHRFNKARSYGKYYQFITSTWRHVNISNRILQHYSRSSSTLAIKQNTRQGSKVTQQCQCSAAAAATHTCTYDISKFDAFDKETKQCKFGHLKLQTSSLLQMNIRHVIIIRSHLHLHFHDLLLHGGYIIQVKNLVVQW